MSKPLQIVELAFILLTVGVWMGVLVARAKSHNWNFTDSLKLMATITVSWTLQALDRIADLVAQSQGLRAVTSVLGAAVAAWFVHIAIGRGWMFWLSIWTCLGLAILGILGTK